MLGERFEAEIREQPQRWCDLAQSDAAARLAAAIDGPALFVGSGSSLFVAELAAFALRRVGRDARAIAASEVCAGDGGRANISTVAISQSGHSADVLDALERLAPRRMIALTNDPSSPLAHRADVVVDIGAGSEVAVPASKSVTCSAALVLWSAALTVRADGAACAAALTAIAADVDTWLAGADDEMTRAAAAADVSGSCIIAGTGAGVAAAGEIALKLREAAYQSADGVAAGEFRHGSTAMLDARSALIGLAGDDDPGGSVERLFAETSGSGAAALVLGGTFGAGPSAGPPAGGLFAPLAWIVAGQMLALALGRARGIDSDAPRGLRKFIGV